MTTDPRETIARSPMTPAQMLVVALTIALNALDGFDVLSISYASPGIAKEWGIDRAALGIVLSMELIGMALGSAFLGGVADRIGRRPTILGCLAIMATGMVMATTASGLAALSTWRIVTGLGIGGMLAAINAVATEFANTRRRHLSVSLMSIGYPLGAVFGGIAAARLLVGHDWRTVFYFGAAVTATLIPIVFVFVPESVHWLVRKQPAAALQRVNRSLAKIGYAATDALPEIPAEDRGRAFADVFAARQISGTVIVTLAYFLHITTFYFIVKWVPKIVVDLGFAASSAAGVLVWTNVGGAIGGAVLGLLTQKYSVKTLTIVVLLASTAAVAAFGRTPADLQRLSIICGLCGFSINAGIVGLYAIIAQVFPTHIRASGTGFTIGVGRGGSVFAPIIAGFLFAAGYGLPIVALLLGLGSFFAAGVLLFLRLETDQPTTERSGRRVVAVQIPAPGHARQEALMRTSHSRIAPFVIGLALCASAAAAQQVPQTATTRPPLVFKEEWRLPPHEGAPTDDNMRFTPAVVKTETVEAKVYGPGSSFVRAAEHEGRIDLWTGLATSPVAVTLRDKRNYVDLTGLARLRWMVRTSSIHTLYPVVRLADGTYIAGNRGITTDGEFVQVEIVFGGMRWYKLDPAKVIVTSEVKNPDFSRVDEVGLVTLAPGGGHGVAGSANLSTVELFAKAVPR